MTPFTSVESKEGKCVLGSHFLVHSAEVFKLSRKVIPLGRPQAEPYIGCLYPCPPIPMGFGLGMGAMLLFMGGATVLCILAFNSKSESNFSDAGNMLTKKRSGLKPTTVNDLLFVRCNQELGVGG